MRNFGKQIFGIRNLGSLKQLPPPQLLFPHPLSQADGAHPQLSTTGAHPQLSTTGAHAGAAHEGANDPQPIGAAQVGAQGAATGAHPPQAEDPQVLQLEIGAGAGAHPPQAEEPQVSQLEIGAAQEGATGPHPHMSAGAAHVGAHPPPLPHPKRPASALLAKQQTASAAAIEKNFILVSWVGFF